MERQWRRGERYDVPAAGPAPTLGGDDIRHGQPYASWPDWMRP